MEKPGLIKKKKTKKCFLCGAKFKPRDEKQKDCSYCEISEQRNFFDFEVF